MPTQVPVYYTPAVFRKRLLINQLVRAYREFRQQDQQFEIKGCHLDMSEVMTLWHRIVTYLAWFCIAAASAVLPRDTTPDSPPVA